MTLHRYTPYYKPLTMLGVPIVVGQLGTIVLAFADTLMIGHHATSELAAAAFVNNIINLVIIFALGFSYAVTPTVGTLYGQEKTQRIGEMVRNAICANLLLAALIVGVMGGFYLSIDHLGQPTELLPLIKPYYLVLLASLPFVCLFNVFKQFADGITDTALSMWVLIGGNILNIFGNWVLIYGQLGAPELGLTGAGLSTLASRVVMAVAMMVVFFSRRKYRAYAQGFLRGRINRADFRQLNLLGWPIALQMGMETSAFSLTSIIVGWIGTTALAAHQVMLTISQVGFMVYYGIGARRRAHQQRDGSARLPCRPGQRLRRLPDRHDAGRGGRRRGLRPAPQHRVALHAQRRRGPPRLAHGMAVPRLSDRRRHAKSSSATASAASPTSARW